MAQFVTTYRRWQIWHEPDDGYLIGTDKSDLDGYYTTREECTTEIDRILSQPREDVPDDTPSLDAPWWEYR